MHVFMYACICTYLCVYLSIYLSMYECIYPSMSFYYSIFVVYIICTYIRASYKAAYLGFCLVSEPKGEAVVDEAKYIIDILVSIFVVLLFYTLFILIAPLSHYTIIPLLLAGI